MQGYKVQGLEILPSEGRIKCMEWKQGLYSGISGARNCFLALEEIFSRSSGDTMTNVERGRVSES